jgi:hypothetical protein
MIYVDTNELTATDGVFRQHVEDQAKARELADAQERLLGPNRRVAVRPKTAEEAGITRQEARVEVRKEHSAQHGGVCIEVAVYSLMKPGAFHRVLLDRRSPTAAVQIAAGACAEECCEKYGDPFDPAQAADAATEAYRRLRDE